MIKFGNKVTDEHRNYYITSDLHFGHRSILRFCPDTRPWKTTEEMDQALIDHWNSVVTDNDVVIQLGDLSFKGGEYTKYIISQLKGTIVHILGNHCKTVRNQVVTPYKYDYLEFRFNGTKVVLSHFPIHCWNQQGRGSVHLFGHTHGNFENVGRSLDVGWDAQGRLLNLQEAVDMCLARPIECPDHHKIVKE